MAGEPHLPSPPPRVTSPRGGAARGLVSWAGRLGRGGAGAGAGAEPWLDDHPWRREGATDESGRDVRNALLGGGLLTAVAAVVGALFLPEVPAEMVLVPAMVVAGFLLGGFWFLGTSVVTLLRRSRHGVAEVRFGRFPFFLGEPLEVTLVRDGAQVRLTGLHARLTCVEEVWGRPMGHADDPIGRATHRSLERRDRWSETRPVRGTFGARVPIRFDLPPPGPGVSRTELSAQLPRYWELELWADLPGLDFQAVFLLPVYQRAADHRPLDQRPGAEAP